MVNHTEADELPSERRFGLVFAAIFTLLGIWLLLRKRSPVGGWMLGCALLLAVLAVVAPAFLKVPNRLWYRLGRLLSLVVSPVVLGLMFLLLITPIAIAMRIAGRDALRMRHKGAGSHWVPRDPVGPAPDSFRNQY
jgi:hypothetical protein